MRLNDRFACVEDEVKSELQRYGGTLSFPIQCMTRGAAVFNPVTHNEWHEQNEKTEATNAA